MNILFFLLIGALAGWLAGQLLKGRGFGIWANMVIGVLGAVIGGVLFDYLGLERGGLIGSLLTATFGAIVLLFVVGLIKRR